jgi:hypothetical protein
VHREPQTPRIDDAALADDVGLVAGVFERSPIRLAIGRDVPHARAVLANARDRFDLPPTRLFIGRAASASAPAAIEVLSVP